MLAAFIIFPAAILAVAFAVMTVFYPEWIADDYKWLGVLPLAVTIGAFVTRRGLNEWWYARFPPKLAKLEREILMKFFPYFRQLTPEQKQEFERRVYVFRLQKQFQMRGAEQLPGDVQLLVAASAVQLTMGFEYQTEFYPKLGMIVLFPKTFITPALNEQLHALEFYDDEVYHCLLMAVNMYVKGLQEPKQYYNMGLYGFGKAWAEAEGYKTESQMLEALKVKAEDKDLFTQQLFILRGLDGAFLRKYTSLDTVELLPLAMELFFTYPDKMQVQMPTQYSALADILGQDPLNELNPKIQQISGQ